ncbi:carboxypeptidase regulatory-like domain-containing protein [Candidatus Woesearchaeota archaeon]|nr:carboxypeptidase regulatory-like domain-containing protein [Candidatus Woesearchaeota archaeon]
MAAGAVVPNTIAENGKWYDCDNSKGACDEPKVNGRCGLTWVAGGEAAAFGEYDTGTSTECCGDDSNEKYRSTAKGGTTYSACCNLATDCVDVGNACVPTGTQSGGFICTSGQWFDGDLSSTDCTNAVGAGNWNLGTGSEVAETTCCGDDLGEYNRFRDCKPGSCVSVPSDKKCCNADKDCVYSGECFYDVDTAISLVQAENTAFCTSKKQEEPCTKGEAKVKCEWTGSNCVATATRAAVQFSQKTGGSYKAYADVNNDGSDEVCVASSPGQWEGSTFGSVSGIVRNITDPAQGALVRVLGTASQATTAADGSYTITNVLTGYHDIVASKSEYEASTAYGVFVPDGATVTVDFTLVRALGGCEDDCTLVGSNLCDASCQGKGLCWFYSDATKAACDGTFGIIEMPGGLMNVDCCKGQPYSPIKADITVPSKNVIVSKKPVLYHGKFINMVMVVFNR